MTKEDAIDIIKSECYVFNPLNFDRSTMVNTALDVAIKALKQEHCEDAISRQALIDKAWDVPYDGKYIQVVDVGDIQDLPPVTTEQEPCDDAISREAVLDACDQSINIFDATDRIKELPSVKPKVKECEDCVSREAVHNLIIPWLNDYLLDETREALETIDYKIEDLPSVTPQPKIGRWIKMGEGFTPYQCSECEKIEFKKSKYCPNCGARMESEEE